MSTQREMTLEEYIGRLPISHRARKEFDVLRYENERLRGYFDKYANHRNDEYTFCDKFIRNNYSCTCGYDEARKALNK